VDGTGTQSPQGGDVSLSRVAFVQGEPIARIKEIEPRHFPVPGYLGQDGGGGDGGHLGIAAHDGRDGTAQHGAAVAIHQGPIRRERQTLDRSLHGQQGGLQDVEGIDLRGAGAGHTPSQGKLLDFGLQEGAPGGGQAFGVIQARDGPSGIEDDGGGGYGTGQGPATRLVNAGDQDCG
jgi:hypothetical protein